MREHKVELAGIVLPAFARGEVKQLCGACGRHGGSRRRSVRVWVWVRVLFTETAQVWMRRMDMCDGTTHP